MPLSKPWRNSPVQSLGSLWFSPRSLCQRRLSQALPVGSTSSSPSPWRFPCCYPHSTLSPSVQRLLHCCSGRGQRVEDCCGDFSIGSIALLSVPPRATCVGAPY